MRLRFANRLFDTRLSSACDVVGGGAKCDDDFKDLLQLDAVPWRRSAASMPRQAKHPGARANRVTPVSYNHLTLPTILRVWSVAVGRRAETTKTILSLKQ